MGDKTPLSPKERTRFNHLKDEVQDWWKDRLRVGKALTEIRDSKLYRQEYRTFEDFCDVEFPEFQFKYAYRLIKYAEIAATVSAPINERQARALAAVPTEQREEVVAEASKNGNKPTAAKITEAAKVVTGKAKPEPTKAKDRFGRIIPDEVLPDWQRAEETGKRLQSLAAQIKNEMERAFEASKSGKSKDIIFAELTNAIITDASALRYSLSVIIPYVVCTTCQGRNRENCTFCKRRGWISKFSYTSFVDKNTRAIIEGK